ncbi:related to Isoleucine--tRNA ligase, mitochondrial [Saccharomycodes ludwigii]|uniref:isoleucine--tRNA ligase n=1 Tax=Saccharomycodes ludwigii TaxID=36035 RepID=A0A376B394_9ASCO|nr:hypothetical protein SCDLUD_001953 [Saccharomycodes ludwigii]KAH3902140.1 hypothetical protein SCDLUD_001953 [Saccharomycodes ludwigii]SSD58600.1 related to Isoleucine--tRNA ligase, mitochondrial [Saccharomycodes ludwigii]
MLKHSYQKTLNLPRTKFPNRSNITNTINKLIPQSSSKLYQEQYQEILSLSSNQNKNNIRDKIFILHDGPPYANGDLHFGHALNKVLKDIINRFQLTCKQKYIWYKPGWDCHGLPIELKALSKLNRDDLSPLKIRKLAKEHALKQVKIQSKQFEKLGILTNWEDRYLTLNPVYELNQLEIFKKMVFNGLIKRQKKPVYWGTVTETALAEGELEYNDNHISIAAYVKFPISDDNRVFPANSKLLIWTSTPWTLFSNRAICFNENFEYCLLSKKKDKKEYLIVEKDLFDRGSIPEVNAAEYETVEVFKGSDKLGRVTYTNPLYDADNCHITFPVLHGAHVTKTAGTGLVHTAPGHGQDDYLLGLKNNLEIYSPVDHKGNYILDENWPSKHIFKNSKVNSTFNVLDPTTTDTILKYLSENNHLLKAHKYMHSYPYDWRSKKPVIIRSTPQWFADLSDIKPLALQSLSTVNFYPARGKTRLSSFIKSRNEWCISRQRSWGVPIPFFYNKSDPDEILMNLETVDHVIEVIRAKGIDSWFVEQDDISEWLPDKYKHLGATYAKAKDTIDVWFDSGSSWTELQQKNIIKNDGMDVIADVYLEGSDQHRGWFQSSLLTKIGSTLKPIAPYKQIITHGFTLDENGIKMSKSIGNIIAPIEIIKGSEGKKLPPLGVDGLRLLVASSNFSTDISVGPTIMKHIAEGLKKIRLSFKFMLGNLNNFDAAHDLLPIEELRGLDKYVLKGTDELMRECKEYYEGYNFSKILTSIQFHLNNELSAFYFNIIKDSLYSDKSNCLKRLQIQSTLYYIFDVYRAILGPIIPIMIQEAYNYSPFNTTIVDKAICDGKSPFTRPWPVFPEINVDYKLEMEILNEFNKLYARFIKLEENNTTVTKTVQTKVNIYISSISNTRFDLDELKDLLQVADISVICSLPSVINENSMSELSSGEKNHIVLEIVKSFDKECPRCWKHNVEEGHELCERCEDVIDAKKP